MHCLRCGAELAEDQVACSNCGFLEEIMGQKTPKKDQPKSEMGESAQVYSGFWRRAAAIILDICILAGGEGLLASIISGLILLMSLIGRHHVDFHIIGSFAVGFGLVFAFGLNWIYFTWFESSKLQGTLGKKIMGLVVADADDQGITFGQANARYWSKILSALFLLAGFWMMFFMKKKQTLHDLIAGTIVIKQRDERFRRRRVPKLEAVE